jgi:hypothetical protein
LSSRLLSKNLRIKKYKAIILAVVLCGCEPCSLTLREECWLRVFENKSLKRIFWPKRNENGEWRRPHNEELNSLFGSRNIVRVIKSIRKRWAGHIARMKDDRSSLNILKGTPSGMRLLGWPRLRWEGNNRMRIKEIGINTRNLIDSAQDRDYWRGIVNSAFNLHLNKLGVIG